MRNRTTLLAVAWYLAMGAVLPGATAQSTPAASGGQNSLSPSEIAAGWISLFDGKTLSGWSPTGDADWQVEDGTITFYKGRGMLRHSGTFGDFEMKADFWGEKTANSGIMIRCTPTGKADGQACYEVNIFDSSATFPTGSINNVHKVPNVPNTAEKWNTFVITVKGTRLNVKLNGETTVDHDDPKLTSGTLAIQASGPEGPGRIKFRNLKVRPL